MNMLILKTRDVKTPTRGTAESAGIDFYVPSDYPGTEYLAHGQSVCLPSGIKAKIPKGHALVFLEKSGVALKKGLQVGAKVIDEDYQGEIHIHVTNVSSDIVAEIQPGEKLVQGLVVPVSYCGIEECLSEHELFDSETERGSGGFGSTGNGLEKQTDEQHAQ